MAQNSSLKVFGSEWFGISVATLALAQVYVLAYQISKDTVFWYIGEIFSLLGISIFSVLFVIWVIRLIVVSDGTHWNSLTRFSFISLIPIIMFVSNAQLLNFFGVSSTSVTLSAINYFIEYFLSLSLGVVLGYRLYTKEIQPREINYGIIIPPLSIGTSVFLALPLMKFYGGILAQTIYFLTLMGLGIFFFLFIFIGSLAFSSHVSTKMPEAFPTTMLLVGVASLIIINLVLIAEMGKIDEMLISISFVKPLSVILWGFEVWNFLVTLILMLAHPPIGSIGVWAYGFPLGLFATSTVELYNLTGLQPLVWVYVIIAIAINTLWVFGWINTGLFLNKAKGAAPKVLGTIRSNGYAYVTISSPASGTVTQALIEGTNLVSTNIVPNVIEAGQNGIVIKFDNVASLVEGKTYNVILIVNIEGKFEEMKATVRYQP